MKPTAAERGDETAAWADPFFGGGFVAAGLRSGILIIPAEVWISCFSSILDWDAHFPRVSFYLKKGSFFQGRSY